MNTCAFNIDGLFFTYTKGERKVKILLALLILFLSLTSPFAYSATLKKKQVVDLPGPIGKNFGSIKLDYKDHYIFLAHQEANQIYVLNSISGKLVRTIPKMQGVRGIEYVERYNKIYTTSPKDNSISVIDLETMKVTKTITAENRPNGIIYVDAVKKLYVSDEKAKRLIVIDARTDRKIATIHFLNETGLAQYDPIRKKMYMNLKDQNSLAVFKPEKDEVEAEFSVDLCKGNNGIAIDPNLHLVFLACEISHTVAIFDEIQHKIIAEITTAPGIDGIVYDPGLKRIYAACDSGAITVIQVEDATHFHKLEDFKTSDKIHSIAVSTESHRVYLPESVDTGTPVTSLITFEAVGQDPLDVPDPLEDDK